MKKLMFLSIALLSAGIYAQDQIQEDLFDVDLMQGNVPFYNRPNVRRGAAVLGGTGAVTGTVDNPVTGATLGAIGASIGAGAGATYDYGKRTYATRRINHTLSKHGAIFRFEKMTRPQAALFLAAYNSDLPRLQRWAPTLQQFVDKPGVLKSLAELYLQRSVKKDDVANFRAEILEFKQ